MATRSPDAEVEEKTPPPHPPLPHLVALDGIVMALLGGSPQEVETALDRAADLLGAVPADELGRLVRGVVCSLVTLGVGSVDPALLRRIPDPPVQVRRPTAREGRGRRSG
jgi:hypothetical protein